MEGSSESTKLTWMYDGNKTQTNQEDYLLGKRVDKNTTCAQTGKSVHIIEHEILPASVARRDVGDLQVDLARKIQEDPLFQIRKAEDRSWQEIMDNPIKLRQYERLTKAEWKRSKREDNEEVKEADDRTKKKKTKKKKMDDLDRKLLKKMALLIGKKGSVRRARSSSVSSSSSDEKHKKKSKKKKEKKGKAKKKRKRRARSPSSCDSSESSAGSSDETPQRSSKTAGREGDGRHEARVSRHAAEKSKSSDTRKMAAGKNQPASHSRPHNDRRRHRSSVSPGEDKIRDNDRPKTTVEKQQDRTGCRVDHKSRLNFERSTSHRDEQRGRIPAQVETSRYHTHKSRHIKESASRASGKHGRNSHDHEDDMERKRRAMMENAKWQESRRVDNLNRHRADESREAQSHAAGSSERPRFLVHQCQRASDLDSLESRVRSNVHRIQRSHDHMQRNFARR